MSLKYHAAWLVLVLAASFAGLWAVGEAARYRALTEQSNAALEAVQARSRALAKLAARHQADAAALRKHIDAQRAVLNHEIEAAPTWADEPLPDGVRRALGGPSGDPSPAPAGGLPDPNLPAQDER